MICSWDTLEVAAPKSVTITATADGTFEITNEAGALALQGVGGGGPH